jgi:hypothetical protein
MEVCGALLSELEVRSMTALSKSISVSSEGSLAEELTLFIELRKSKPARSDVESNLYNFA